MSGRTLAGSTTSDLGYRVEIDRGYLTTYTVSLVACDRNSTVSLGSQVLRGVGRALAARAFAGHSDEVDDSALPYSTVEDLVALEATELGGTAFDADEYCEVHYLVGPASEVAEDMPDDLAQLGATLTLVGVAYPADSSVGVPFSLWTDLANGELLAFTDSTLAPLVGTGVEARILRRPSTWFDGVDFVSATESEINRAILGNILDDVRVQLTPLD